MKNIAQIKSEYKEALEAREKEREESTLYQIERAVTQCLSDGKTSFEWSLVPVSENVKQHLRNAGFTIKDSEPGIIISWE